MGKPPALIFIVRHGNRLDAADKQWHLTSPTPYDPPLTYGGFQQAKTLGARIYSIIREKILEEEVAASQHPSNSTRRKRKRYKVVLHSSPFLRCVQTSIGVAAGLAQDPTPLVTSTLSSNSATSVAPLPRTDDAAARGRPTVVTNLHIPETATINGGRIGPTRRSVLRLDAFLGEWLTPGYYERITPPPESVMMLATAKADLLRREDYTNYPNFPTHAQSNSQSQLWASGGSASNGVSASDNGARPNPASTTTEGLENMTSVGSSLPSSSVNGHASQQQPVTSAPGGYLGPVPNYAISSSAPIPLGYVAHARNACAEIDYQWDSMRGPLEWGDGGKYGEEWTAMHQRFRKGVQALVDWYVATDAPADMMTKTAAARLAAARGEAVVEDDEDVETEVVVVLVSHGAGCNALIGAVTHQPVLMDVSMASLTLAVRKPEEPASAEGGDVGNVGENGTTEPVTSETSVSKIVVSETVASDNVASKNDASATAAAAAQLEDGKAETTPLHQLYDLKIFANTDHLRPSTASTPTSTSSSRPASTVGTRVRHGNSFSSSLSNFSYGGDAAGSWSPPASGALSGITGTNPRRGSNSAPRSAYGTVMNGGGITVGSGMTSFSLNKLSGFSRTPSIGLWSPMGRADEEDEDDEDWTLNFSHEKTASSIKTATTESNGSSALAHTSTTVHDTSPATKQNPALDSITNIMLRESVARPALSSRSSFLDEKLELPFSSLGGLGIGAGAGGLWGAGGGELQSPGESDLMRDLNGSKRRWTVNERV